MELTHRQEIILREVWKMYQILDKESLPERVRERWINRVKQVPVFRLYSEKYDLNLVKEHFIKTLSNVSNVTVTKKDNLYMSLMTPSFKFLDVKNYLAPDLSYDGWCRVNGCEVQKLVCPYRWLDDYYKLRHGRPVEYENFYSKLKGGFMITLEEYKDFV